MSKKILMVGCGELGSRHLQALGALGDVAQIDVVDKSAASLEKGKGRLKETPGLNLKIRFNWLADFKKAGKEGDLCVVATQAPGRPLLIKEIANDLGYKNFLIEKIVSQSVEEYKDLMEFARSKKLSIWVNCKTRAYKIHQYIKSKLEPKEPILFSAIGGNHGLGNNGIHEVDLFVFHDESKTLHSAGSHADSVLHTSKRGADIFDLSGTLCGYSDKGSQFTISFAGGHMASDHISIVTPRCRFIVDHLQKFAMESFADANWQWRPVPLDENIMVSHMTKAFASDILQSGRCRLPTLEECFPAHEFILKELLGHFNRLRHTKDNVCPIT